MLFFLVICLIPVRVVAITTSARSAILMEEHSHRILYSENIYEPMLIASITKIITFDSSHKLLNYSGKCSELHGHTYKLEVTVRKRIDLKTGMVMDFGDLKNIIKQYVVNKLDHTYLNNTIPQFNPTAENMVFWIWETLEKDALLKGLYEIKLWETPNSHVHITQRDIFMSPLYAMSYYNDMVKHCKWEEPII